MLAKHKRRKDKREEATALIAPDKKVPPESFQIFVNILEGRNLVMANPQSANTYVVAMLDGKTRRTSTRNNTINPKYGEYLLFDLTASILEMRRTTLWLAVMEPTLAAPKVLGETTTDLETVWDQPNHQVNQKWLRLHSSKQNDDTTGYLKLDIIMVHLGNVQVMGDRLGRDNIKGLVFPVGLEQHRVNYVMTIHGAFGLPCTPYTFAGHKMGKPPNTFVRLSFCGHSAKTEVQHRNSNPKYLGNISVSEVILDVNQAIYFEVFSVESCISRFFAGTSLKLSKISHEGENGFLPTFGPSLLHMYSNSALSHSPDSIEEVGPFHRGSLLVSVKTQMCPNHLKNNGKMFVQPVEAVNSRNLWSLENFSIFCPLLEVAMIDCPTTKNNCGVAITIGEMPTSTKIEAEFLEFINQIKSKKLHYTGPMNVHRTTSDYGYLNFQNSFPVLQLATQLPDFRFRCFSNNILEKTIIHLEQAVNEIEKIKSVKNNSQEEKFYRCINGAQCAIDQFLQITNTSRHKGDHQYMTELDEKQFALQKEEMEKIHQILESIIKQFNSSKAAYSLDNDTSSKKSLKLCSAEIKTVLENLKNLAFRGLEGWPDIVVWLLNNGSRFAFHRIPLADIIYSVIPEQMGKYCGEVRSIYLKPFKCLRHIPPKDCDCVAGKLEIIAWMSLYQQIEDFENYLPLGFKIRRKDYAITLKTNPTMLECRAFIHRATLNDNCLVKSYPAIRVNVLNSSKEIKSLQQTSRPIFNETVKIYSTAFTTVDRLSKSPPVAVIELFDSNSVEKMLIGRCEIQSVLEDRPEYEYSPKLKWHKLEHNGKFVGKVLMSLQVLKVEEKMIRCTSYGTQEDCGLRILSGLKQENKSNKANEPVPAVIIPKFNSYKVDVYWWGLRDVVVAKNPCVVLEIDELSIKSQVIDDNKPSCNFPKGLVSHVIEDPLTETVASSITVHLLDSATFGRTFCHSKKTVRNPSKYVVEWLPLETRSSVLNSNSKINLLNLGYKEERDDSIDDDNSFENKNNANNLRNKLVLRVMHQINFCFNCTKNSEEEYSLIPMYSKRNNSAVDNNEYIKNDWWSRFISSQEQEKESIQNEEKSEEAIIIYKSELESQPEFGKLKDWCSTVKLYYGSKTGIPQKDQKLQCGVVKVGIAMYKWPPTNNTLVVSHSGTDLHKGYFDDHPDNKPTGLLVRVYVIQALNLKSRDVTHKSDAYVSVTCGKRFMGDRKHHASNTNNPVFAKMFEFKCNLPEEYKITVSVYDHDVTQLDELIGSTSIDVEDRFYSKHKARVGLPKQYNLSGAAKWRDCVKPSMILEEICSNNHLPAPLYPTPGVVIANNVTYVATNDDSDIFTVSRKEAVCLKILHNFHTTPLCGYHLVPEHVETRTLYSYNQERSSEGQGQIQMWVDIFPLDKLHSVPPPIDISPREPQDYELRLIVWDLKLFNIHEKPLNIYVKAWLGSNEEAQYTDVHYKSTNGEGEFNWRMIFNFKYLIAEKEIIHIDKGPFIEYRERTSPNLVVLAYNNDVADDEHCLGALSLNLSAMPQSSAELTGKPYFEDKKTTNLFHTRTKRGSFPLKSVDPLNMNTKKIGTIDLELSVMLQSKAIVCPAGLGREPPLPLPEPRRKLSGRRSFANLDSMLSEGKQELVFSAVLFLVSLGIILFFVCFDITIQ